MSRVLFLSFLVCVASFARAEPTVIVLGDSLSAAYGMPTEQGWVALLQTRLREQGFPHRVINASVTGDTTDGGLSRLPKLLDEDRPELLVIELGGNDGLRGAAPKRIEKNLARLVGMGQAADAEVLLLGIKIPFNYGPFYTRAFEKVYPKVAEAKGAELVDFFMDGVALKRDMLQSDGIHPNADAQPVLLDNTWPQIQQLLRD